MNACGCPTHPGRSITDPERHAAWHREVAAQTGITRGPVDLAALRTAAGIRTDYVPPLIPTVVDHRAVASGKRRSSHTTYAAAVGALDTPRADVGLDAPEESQAAARGALRTSRSTRALVLALVAVRWDQGATSDEVEAHTGRAHQSVSATLYGLEQDGLVERTGPTRTTRQGAEARAYVATVHGRAELRRVGVPHPGEW